MKLSITAEIIKKEFPDIYKEFQEKKKKSKAKSSSIPLDKFRFSFGVAERIQGYKFSDVISGKAFEDKKKESEKTVNEQLQEQLKNVSVYISASSGRYRLNSDILKKIPKQIKDKYRKMLQEQENERKRVETMTPEERYKETEKVLKELRKYPGFFEMHIPIGGHD